MRTTYYVHGPWERVGDGPLIERLYKGQSGHQLADLVGGWAQK